MRIIQLLPTISFGDAIGNDTLAIMDILVEMGMQTAIYAENIDQRIKSKRIFHYEDMPLLNKEDILIFHMSTGTQLVYLIEKLHCRKIMIYHNITPPDFFRLYNNVAVNLSRNGIEQMKYLADMFDYCIADSEYNKQELVSYGYRCPICVIPIIIPFKEYYQKPNRKILKNYNDDKINLMFLGRISPNKKQEDIIATFYYYKRYYNSNARLFLVGSWQGMERYYNRLQRYIAQLGIGDVYFTGHVKFDEILAYYRLADMFICMSEHEGFCVPLIEAMFFKTPILAYSSSAIPYTMDGAGILLNKKQPDIDAGIIDKVIKSEYLYRSIVEKQTQRLEKLSYKVVRKQIVDFLLNFMENVQ